MDDRGIVRSIKLRFPVNSDFAAEDVINAFKDDGMRNVPHPQGVSQRLRHHADFKNVGKTTRFRGNTPYETTLWRRLR